MIFVFTILPVFVAWAVFAAIWHFIGRTRPNAAGSLILFFGLIASAIYLIVFEGFFLLGLGFFVLVPALTVAAISVSYFVLALRAGRAGSVADLQAAKRVLKDVYDGSHR